MAYPANIDSFTTKIDGVTDVLAADMNNLQSSVVAIQNKVGISGSSIPGTIDYLLKPQTWSSTGKGIGTTYTNSTGRPIFVDVSWIRGANTNGYINLYATVAGVVISNNRRYFNTTDETANVQFVVPNGASYRCDQTGMAGGTTTWNELA